MKLRRLVPVIGVIAVAASVAAVLYFDREDTPSLVKVRTGERVECTYGHVVSDDVMEIEVDADDAGRYRVTTRAVTCAKHQKVEALYAKAQDAIAKGDLKGARAALTELLELDPDFGKAGEQAKLIDEGKTPGPDSSGGSTGTPGDDPAEEPGEDPSPDDPDEGKAPLGPVDVLKKYVPDDIPGYKAGEILDDPFALTRQYVPTASSGPLGLVIVVEQYTDANWAAKAVARYKSRYGEDRSTVSAGDRQIYFGTRPSYAAITWSDGAVVVVAEMVARDGADPAGLKDDMQVVVEAVLE